MVYTDNINNMKGSTVNTVIEYMYRDAYNYKQHGDVVVAGHDDDLIGRLVASLDEGENFLPEEVGLPNLRDGGWDTHHDDADHVWHEYVDAERTGRAPTDPRPLAELVAVFEAAAAAGWPMGAALAALEGFVASTPEGW